MRLVDFDSSVGPSLPNRGTTIPVETRPREPRTNPASFVGRDPKSEEHEAPALRSICDLRSSVIQAPLSHLRIGGGLRAPHHPTCVRSVRGIDSNYAGARIQPLDARIQHVEGKSIQTGHDSSVRVVDPLSTRPASQQAQTSVDFANVLVSELARPIQRFRSSTAGMER